MEDLIEDCWQALVSDGQPTMMSSSRGPDDSTPSIALTEENSKTNNLSQSDRDGDYETTVAKGEGGEDEIIFVKSPLRRKMKEQWASPKKALSASSLRGTKDESSSGSRNPSRTNRHSRSKPGAKSTVINQIFSGELPSNVSVEGMPVDPIRKLVARQMSMSAQLLTQVRHT